MAYTGQLMGRWLYSLLVYVLLPVVLAFFFYRSISDPRYRRGLRERLGYPGCQPPPGSIWVHAASVGEAIAAIPVIREILTSMANRAVMVTTMTPTGAERIRVAFGDSVYRCYLPYDAPHLVKRFLSRISPGMLIILETELWPNLIHTCYRHNVPVVLANARMSEGSARGYARFRFLSRPLFSELDWVAAQAAPDAERFCQLGVPQERITVIGSIKYDVAIADRDRQEARRLRDAIGRGRPVWIGASTHEGEDELLLEAHERLLQRVPGALLVLVPRHPERFEGVFSMIQGRGLSAARRSVRDDPADASAYLADTMGELLMLLGVADVVFMGGSLIERGGHNPLEAAAWSLPVLTGPHVFNFASVFAQLSENNGAQEVRTVSEIVSALSALLLHEDARYSMGRNANAVVAANRGALEKLVAGITERASGSAFA